MKPVSSKIIPKPQESVSQEDLTRLWAQYKRNRQNPQLRDQLILQYLHLVRYVVSRLPVMLPVSITPDDLVSFGTLGLIEAFERFDIDRGLKFETYAITRIRGSIIDQLRYFDWVPRGVRKRSKDLHETSHKLEQKFGRVPTEDELAEAMGVTTQRLKTIVNESNNLVISLDEARGSSDDNNTSLLDLIEDKNAADPDTELESNDLKSRLANAIERLPEREKLLIALYYHENLTLKEIGDVLNVSESRVCQLHAQAILRLRNNLSEE